MGEFTSDYLFQNFLGVVKDVLKDVYSAEIEENIPKEPCPNQVVGSISEIVGQVDSPCRVPFKRENVTDDVCRDHTSKRVVAILESPHKDEFQQSGTGLRPIGPACGCTGCLLVRNWREVFGNEFDDYKLILVNVVRFQCSLAAAGAYRKYKNAIFNRCLKNKILESDFEGEVKKLKNERTIFINACTGGESIFSANKMVSRILSELEVDAVSLWHPSAWTCPKAVAKQRSSFVAYSNKNRIIA